MVKDLLHITSGDVAGSSLTQSGLPGEVFAWRDVLYDGPRRAPGWPDEETLRGRAGFLADGTGGGLSQDKVLGMLRRQYARLAESANSAALVLWFDACLFDQAMLAHLLTCLRLKGAQKVELLCVDAFPGIVPFDGLGQLQPQQLASLYDRRRPVTADQFAFADVVDAAFATQDLVRLRELADRSDAPLPWVPAAARRWLQEQPDPATGLGRLELLAFRAIQEGCDTPAKLFTTVAARDTHPQYWGDTTLWAKINALAARTPPLVRIEGPTPRLPLWEGQGALKRFRITSLLGGAGSGESRKKG